MSLAEMKVRVIQKLTQIDDEATIRKVEEIVDKPDYRQMSADEVYERVKAKYGETLKRLAE